MDRDAKGPSVGQRFAKEDGETDYKVYIIFNKRTTIGCREGIAGSRSRWWWCECESDETTTETETTARSAEEVPGGTNRHASQEERRRRVARDYYDYDYRHRPAKEEETGRRY